MTGMEFAGLGGMLAGAFVIPMLAGLGIDHAARTGPVFFLLGLVLGVVGAVAVGYTRIRRLL